MKKSYIVDSTCNDMRIDRWIRLTLGKIPQGLIEKYLRAGKVKLNKKKVKSSQKIKTNIMKSSELGLSAMYRILKKAGAERVSDESADELRRVIEDVADNIAKNAVDMASHAGRKTIKGEDVKLASKAFNKF